MTLALNSSGKNHLEGGGCRLTKGEIEKSEAGWGGGLTVLVVWNVDAIAYFNMNGFENVLDYG